MLKHAYSLTNCGVGCTSHSPNQLLSPLKLICLAFPASRDSHGIENHCTKEKEGGEGSEIGPFPVIVGQLLLMPKCKRNFYCLSSPLSPPQLDVGASPNPLALAPSLAPNSPHAPPPLTTGENADGNGAVKSRRGVSDPLLAIRHEATAEDGKMEGGSEGGWST